MAKYHLHAVFKDKRGLSVERAGDRNEDKVINDMHLFFYGTLISIMAGDCVREVFAQDCIRRDYFKHRIIFAESFTTQRYLYPLSDRKTEKSPKALPSDSLLM